MSLRAQALYGFRWTATARMASQVITWAITLLVIRLLTPADYGLLAMAMVFVTFLAMFSEFGLGAALVQRPHLDDELLRRVFTFIVGVHLVLAGLLVSIAPLVASFYGEPRVVPVVRVLALQIVLSAFAIIPDALLQRRMEFRERSLLDLSASILASLTTLAMAYSGAGVWALVVGSVIGQGWRTIGVNRLAPFVRWPDLSLKGMRSLLAFGGRMTAAGALGTFFSQVDIIICGKILGNAILGSYSVAVQLASMPSQKIASLINSVAFPTFSRMQHDLTKVASNLLLGVRILSFFAFPVLWGISSIAPEITEVILGPQWGLAAIPIQVLALVIPLRIVGNFVGIAVQSVGRSDIVLRNTIWAVVAGPPVLLLGASYGGLIGLCLAWLAVSPMLFLFVLVRSAPAIGLGAGQVLRAMAPAASAGFLMFAAVTLLRPLFMAGHPGMGGMLGLIVLGAVSYSGLSLALNRKGTLEVLGMVRSIAVPQ